MALSFRQLKKVSNNPWSYVLNDTSNPYGIEEYFDTNCYILNAVLSDGDINKGCILGKKYCFSGEASTGKSLFSAYIVKSFLEQDKDRVAVIYETEGSSIKEMFEKIDVDMERVIVEPVNIIEELQTNIFKYIEELESDYLETKERTKMIFVLDSLGMLVSRKEVEDVSANKEVRDMTRAQAIKKFYRLVSLKLALLKISMITINHSYTNIGGYGDSQVESGGSGFMYAGDVRLLLSKSQKKTGTLQSGITVKVKVKKSRFIKENQTFNIDIDWEKGLNKFSYMVELANIVGMLKATDSKVTFEGNKYGRQMFEDNFDKYFNAEKMKTLAERIKNNLTFGADDNIEAMSVEKLVQYGITFGMIQDTPRLIILPDGIKIKKNELKFSEDLIPEDLLEKIKQKLTETENEEVKEMEKEE
ncbi:hypothetical protein J6W34_09325 [bacterium]|nr:hypothetical protein [bacterium]